jgi:hypothetical protein
LGHEREEKDINWEVVTDIIFGRGGQENMYPVLKVARQYTLVLLVGAMDRCIGLELFFIM